jgi:hypothetical protein
LKKEFRRIADQINEKFTYRPAETRIFERIQLYEDLKIKLLNNLILASKVAKKDGTVIINKYKCV